MESAGAAADAGGGAADSTATPCEFDEDRPAKRARTDEAEADPGAAPPEPVELQQELYCICRQPYDEILKPPMICCDKCDVWYHIACITVSEEMMARIKVYYCDVCREQDPELKITFKKPRKPRAGRKATPTPPPPPPPCRSRGCSALSDPPSMYCSKQCGLAEAGRRLDLLLQYEQVPKSKDEVVWAADGEDLDEIEKINTHCTEVQSRLDELDVLRTRLAANVERAQAAVLPDEPETDEGLKSDPTATIDCFSCHNEYPLAKAQNGIISHLHKCHLKLEAEVMVTQDEPTEVADCPVKSFCNAYDKTTQTYCSRFHATCPKHGPSAKFSLGRPGEVCGYPLHMDNDPESTEMCRREKRKCLEHAGWINLHSARLELETVQQCMYRVYLREKRESVSQRLQRRHTVLSRAGHSTTEHTAAEAKVLSEVAFREAMQVRERLDAQTATVRASAAKKSNELTGGSLGLPQRHWR